MSDAVRSSIGLDELEDAARDRVICMFTAGVQSPVYVFLAAAQQSYLLNRTQFTAIRLRLDAIRLPSDAIIRLRLDL